MQTRRQVDYDPSSEFRKNTTPAKHDEQFAYRLNWHNDFSPRTQNREYFPYSFDFAAIRSDFVCAR